MESELSALVRLDDFYEITFPQQRQYRASRPTAESDIATAKRGSEITITGQVKKTEIKNNKIYITLAMRPNEPDPKDRQYRTAVFPLEKDKSLVEILKNRAEIINPTPGFLAALLTFLTGLTQAVSSKKK
jgi:hypothetical protein